MIRMISMLLRERVSATNEQMTTDNEQIFVFNYVDAGKNQFEMTPS